MIMVRQQIWPHGSDLKIAIWPLLNTVTISLSYLSETTGQIFFKLAQDVPLVV